MRTWVTLSAVVFGVVIGAMVSVGLIANAQEADEQAATTQSIQKSPSIQVETLPPKPRPSHAMHAGITVQGEGIVEAVPDQAMFSFSIITKDMKLPVAKEQNDTKLAQMTKVITELGIDDTHVALSNLRISPDYRWEEKTRKRLFDGYSVARSIRVTLKELEAYETLLSAVVDNDIDQVEGVQFTFADPQAHQNEARLKAVAHAKAMASDIAKVLGMQLGTALNITVGNVPHQSPVPVMKRAMLMAESSAADNSGAQALPGLQSVRQTVTITFALQ